MNTRDLEYLVAVVEQRSFSKAAQKCQASQPTLSAQIKKLEDQLGVSLLERNNKTVLPTPIGEQVATVAKKLLREVEHIKDIAESATSPLGGNFRIGAFPTIAPLVFPKLVDMVKAKLPELKLVLVEEKSEVLIEKLIIGQLEAAFLAMPVDDPKLETRSLFTENFCVCVPESHELTGDVEVDQLLKYRLILVETGHCMRDQVTEFCKLTGLEEENEFEASSVETLKQMVRAGSGISLVPKSAASEEAGLRFRDFKTRHPSREIALAYRKTTLRSEVINTICSEATFF